MIDLLRLDERLIHGQVATSWVKTLKPDTLLVIDDASATDAFLTKTLYMAAPAGIKTFVMTIEQALGVLNDPRCKTRHIFVVVKSIETLNEIASKAADVKEICVANYGRMQAANIERVRYTGNLFLSDEERAKLKEVLSTGIPCNIQMIPENPKTPLESILKDVG